jgi:flagellar motility protein MotE (MotC chaperone)
MVETAQATMSARPKTSKAGGRTDKAGKKPVDQASVGLKTSRLRLLPVVIFLAVLMLSIRLGGLWQDYTQIFAALQVGSNAALAEPQDQSGRPAPSVTRLQTPLSNPGDTPLQLAQSAGEQSAAKPAEAAVPSGGTASLNGASADPLKDPVNFTQSEIELLQKLAERRELIESRSQELEQREALLKAAEGRIDRKIGELQQLQGTIDALLKQHDEQEQQKVAQLVKIYATMKPKDAARIFNDLDMPILITVLENMKESKSAPILAAMSADKARLVTEEMSRRRSIPLPGNG